MITDTSSQSVISDTQVIGGSNPKTLCPGRQQRPAHAGGPEGGVVPVVRQSHRHLAGSHARALEDLEEGVAVSRTPPVGRCPGRGH
jgi:hypothetical protein